MGPAEAGGCVRTKPPAPGLLSRRQQELRPLKGAPSSAASLPWEERCDVHPTHHYH